MKQLYCFRLVVILIFLGWGRLAAGTADGPEPGGVSNRAARVQLLAADVREIAGSSLISRAKKEKRISTAVRVAVVAATAYRRDQGEVLGIALELTAAAARAAPAYAEVVANAVSFAPAVSRIEGASGQVRATAMAAARGRRTRPAVAVAESEPGPERLPRPRKRAPQPEETDPVTQTPADDENMVNEPVRRHRSTAPVQEAAAADYASNLDDKAGSSSSYSPGISLGDNSSLNLGTSITVRRDDNVFLSNSNKTSDTIVSVTPNAEFRFGQASQVNGSLGYQEAFNRYTGKSAPNVSLGTGNGSFAYDDGGIAATLDGSYQQYYESNPSVLVLGLNELVRSNVFGLDGSVETQLGAKMSVKAGTTYNSTAYVTPGFLDRRYFSVPLNFYFKATPKVDLSAGYTLGSERPGGGGPSARDNYYNLGARGSFTPKLSGNFTLGYQSRTVAGDAADHLFAFSGAFDYQITAKTKATLNATRNFGASAVGQSTKNSSYSLGLTSDLTPQWQVGTNLTYQDNYYGPAVFALGSAPLAGMRQDRYWQGNLLVSYLYSAWLSTSASYSFRNDHSTTPGLEFTDNSLSLSVGLKY